MRTENLPEAEIKDSKPRSWQSYIPLIIIVIVVPVLIWAGISRGSMLKKNREAYAERKAAEPIAEPTIKRLPPVTLQGKSYQVIAIDSLVWMAENLDYDIGEGSLCLDDDPAYCSKYGRLYTYAGATKACAAIGWRLPTKTEWDALRRSFRTDRDVRDPAYNALIKGGKTGFDGVLGGGYSFYKDKAEKPGSIGSYWSSTEYKEGDEMVWKYAFRTKEEILSRDLCGKNWAWSCRCVKPVTIIQKKSNENTNLD